MDVAPKPIECDSAHYRSASSRQRYTIKASKLSVDAIISLRFESSMARSKKRIQLSIVWLLLNNPGRRRGSGMQQVEAFTPGARVGFPSTITGNSRSRSVRAADKPNGGQRNDFSDLVLENAGNEPSVSPAGSSDIADTKNYTDAFQLAELALKRVKEGEHLTTEDYKGIITVCRRQKTLEWILNVIQQSGNPVRVESTLRSLLYCCHDASSAKVALRVLEVLKGAGFKVKTKDVSTVVHSVCRANANERGFWKTVMPLIHDNPVMDIEAYEALLSCMTHEGYWKEATRLLRKIELQNITRPPISTYAQVIECCVYCNKAEPAVQNLLACVQQGMAPTVALFESVIAVLSRWLLWRRSMQLLNLMEELKYPRSLSVFNHVMSALAKSGESIQAKRLLQRMKKDGVKPDILSFNCAISACVNMRSWKDALMIFDQCLREPGVTPDIYTYTNAIRACAKGGKIDRALSLLEVAKDLKLPLDVYFYTAAIEACSKVKMWKKAIRLLDEMEANGISPSEVSYSVTITACGNGGNWRKALELLDIMTKKNMKINLITYNAAIAALSKAAKTEEVKHKDTEMWKIALELLKKMERAGIVPDGFSFSSAISCCGADGQWEEALKLLDMMKSGGPQTQPNKIAYTAAVASCARAGQVQRAFDVFNEMKERGLIPDRVAYNSLLTGCRIAGEGKLASKLWREMTNNETVKNAAVRDDAKTPVDTMVAPDEITVMEAIGAMTRSGLYEEVNNLFADAVRRGIIFHADSYDTRWEIDLTKMTLSVARAACHFILNRAVVMRRNGEELEDLVFITGVGVGKYHDADHPSLRDYIQDLLSSAFNPPIRSEIPRLAGGTVVVHKDDLQFWACQQG